MSGWVYRRVTADWHWLKTPEGLFFGRSKEEVFGKARQHEAFRHSAFTHLETGALPASQTIN